MPRVGGREIMRLLRALGFDIPVVIITGSRLEEDGVNFASSSAAHAVFLGKPFSQSDLQSILKKIMPAVEASLRDRELMLKGLAGIRGSPVRPKNQMNVSSKLTPDKKSNVGEVESVDDVEALLDTTFSDGQGKHVQYSPVREDKRKDKRTILETSLGNEKTGIIRRNVSAAPSYPQDPLTSNNEGHILVPTHPRKPTILVVDDEKVCRLVGEKIIRSLEREALLAANGEEALKLLEQNPSLNLEAILMDVDVSICLFCNFNRNHVI